jgi:rsbT co-antagonist protein RsbR
MRRPLATEVESNKPIEVGVDITEQELLRRKDFLEFGDEDIANLAGINDLAQRYATSVIEDFYRHLLSFEETRTFFKDPEVLQHVKTAQQDYFLRLTQGNYDLAYAQNRLTIGTIHERIELPVKAYLGMYNYYLRTVATRLTEAYRDEPRRAWSAFLSLMKLTFLDMGLAIDTYIYARERTIREQQQAIQELPTPVLPFREGMLLVPIIGLIDTLRARLLTEQLLAAVRDHRAKVVLIDITGVQAVDSKVANYGADGRSGPAHGGDGDSRRGLARDCPDDGHAWHRSRSNDDGRRSAKRYRAGGRASRLYRDEGP